MLVAIRFLCNLGVKHISNLLIQRCKLPESCKTGGASELNVAINMYALSANVTQYGSAYRRNIRCGKNSQADRQTQNHCDIVDVAGSLLNRPNPGFFIKHRMQSLSVIGCVTLAIVNSWLTNLYRVIVFS